MTKTNIKDPRRVHDYWTKKAKAEKYPARSVFKLEEIDKKHGLLKPGQKVIDLGCSPGSWTMYAAGKVGPGGLVIGLDIQEVNGKFAANTRILSADVLQTPPESLLPEGPFDVLLSDMAPKTTGNKVADQARSVELAEAAARWAWVLLKPGGALLFKIFQSPDADELFRDLKPHYQSIRRIKPKSSRTISPEIFGLCLGINNDQ